MGFLSNFFNDDGWYPTPPGTPIFKDLGTVVEYNHLVKRVQERYQRAYYEYKDIKDILDDPMSYEAKDRLTPHIIISLDMRISEVTNSMDGLKASHINIHNTIQKPPRKGKCEPSQFVRLDEQMTNLKASIGALDSLIEDEKGRFKSPNRVDVKVAG